MSDYFCRACIYLTITVYNENDEVSSLAKYAKGDHMRELFLILVMLVAGCASLPADFDNNEYALANRIFTLAEVHKVGCGDAQKTKQNFNELATLSLELVNYSADIPNNNDTVKLVAPMHKMISEASVKFSTESHTATYCKLKLDNIELAAGIVKHAIAQRRMK